MKRNKATVATATIAVMLCIITACLYSLWRPGFVILIGALSAGGVLAGAAVFGNWLREEDPIKVLALRGKPYDWNMEGKQPEPMDAKAFDETIDAIVREFSKETA